jgi:hypothetical protein
MDNTTIDKKRKSRGEREKTGIKIGGNKSGRAFRVWGH